MLSFVSIAIGAALLALGMTTRLPVLAVIGVAYAAGGWMAKRASSARKRSTISPPRWRRWSAGVLVGAGGLLTGLFAYLWVHGIPATPDAFYATPPAPPSRPGVLLRAEPFTRALPAGTRAWRILYTTTIGDNRPAIASAVVLAPSAAPSAPLPVIAWTHGTTGVASGCAPTVLPAPFPFDATVPALESLVAEKWALVGTDYVGLGTAGVHQYLIGEPAGRAALDAVRAARQLEGLTLDRRTVVWGHSQGGHAALWTGILAPAYAPDVNVIGVAALAPATEIGALVEAAQYTVVGKIMASYVMSAYSATYHDVRWEEYVRPRARARAMASRCLSGPGALLSVGTALTLETPFFAIPPTSGVLGERFKQNVPTAKIASPLLVAQGLRDELVLPDVQGRYVRERCKAGQRLEYRPYDGRDHMSLVARDSGLTDDLMQWTRQRFAGIAAPPGCPGVAP